MKSSAAFKTASLSIKNAVQPLTPHARQQVLWQELQASLSSNSEGIGWLLEELGRFLDSESKKLLQSVKTANEKS